MTNYMTSKFQMTDAKSGIDLNTGKIFMSLYTTYRCVDKNNILEAELLLSLLGGYNKHGRQFDLIKFKELQNEFKEIINQAEDILIEVEKK